MNRDYGNNITQYQVTGFASPCAEYAEKGLSLDERYDSFNPALRRIEASCDAPLFGIRKGDLLDVLTGVEPIHNNLVLAIIHGEVGVFRFEKCLGQASLFPGQFSGAELEEAVAGVITAQHRELYTLDK